MIRLRVPSSVVFLLGVAALAGAEEKAWLTSLDDALTESKTGDQLILVDLYADWCGWCKQLEKEVFSTPAFQEYAGDFILLRVDTEDGAEGTRLQETYGVFSLPTMLVLDHRQVKIGEIRGFAPVQHYIGRIDHEISTFRELEDGFRRFRESSDHRVLAVLAREFHERRDGERASSLYRRILSLEPRPDDDPTWTRYQLSDALRLARRFDDAMAELVAARAEAAKTDDGPLLERLELLAAEIALDRGDCHEARAALEEFLGRNPSYELKRYAQRALATLEAEGVRCT